jgi:hypothetical protein
MSIIRSDSDHLTLNAQGTSKSIKFQSAGVEKASISSVGFLTSTTIDATKLTGNLPAIDGSNLTGLVHTDSTKLPLAGGTLTGNITFNSSQTFDASKVTTGTIADARISTLTSSKLSGALPAISGAALTGMVSLSADQSWTGSQRATIVANTTGSFDMNAGQNFKCTVSSGTITITFTNITDGQSGFILLVNSGATMAAAGTTKVDANLLATITVAGTYLVSYLTDGTNVYLTNSAIYT